MCSIGKWFLVIATLVGPAGLTRAQAPAEPPLVGQPEDFNGAVGEFQVEATAEPTVVAAGKPLLYRLRVTSKGAVRQPPRRPNLRKLAKFRDLFQIEDGIAEDRVIDGADGRQWEFVYQLRPRTADVKSIPAFRFVYYKPPTGPGRQGFYRYPWTHALELTVRPTETTATLPAAPARFQQLVDGPELLRRDEPPRLPAGWILALLAVLPPVLCGLWYFIWQRFYPNAAQAARRRRSQAARTALQSLRGAAGEGAELRAERAAAALTTYLRQRLDLPLADASPAQAGERLRQLGIPRPLSEQVAELLQTCDAARFAADLLPSEQDLPGRTENLILALESQPWLSPLS